MGPSAQPHNVVLMRREPHPSLRLRKRCHARQDVGNSFVNSDVLSGRAGPLGSARFLRLSQGSSTGLRGGLHAPEQEFCRTHGTRPIVPSYILRHGGGPVHHPSKAFDPARAFPRYPCSPDAAHLRTSDRRSPHGGRTATACHPFRPAAGSAVPSRSGRWVQKTRVSLKCPRMAGYPPLCTGPLRATEAVG